MKKLISLALAALLLLNLAACGESSVPNPSGSSGDSSSSADPAQPDAFSPVTTEAEVRALYGDDASLITSIEAYQGDFLVKLGTDDSCPSLDWVCRLSLGRESEVRREARDNLLAVHLALAKERKEGRLDAHKNQVDRLIFAAIAQWAE